MPIKYQLSTFCAVIGSSSSSLNWKSSPIISSDILCKCDFSSNKNYRKLAFFKNKIVIFSAFLIHHRCNWHLRLNSFNKSDCKQCSCIHSTKRQSWVDQTLVQYNKWMFWWENRAMASRFVVGECGEFHLTFALSSKSFHRVHWTHCVNSLSFRHLNCNNRFIELCLWNQLMSRKSKFIWNIMKSRESIAITSD